MIRTKHINLMLVLMLLVSGLVSGQMLQKESGRFSTTLEHSFGVNPGGYLDMSNVTADVDIESWDKPEVWISEDIDLEVYTREEAREIVDRFKACTEQDGNTIRIACPSLMDVDTHRYTIRCPETFNLTIRLNRGDIRITQVAGTLRIDTRSGDVTLDGVSGETTLRTKGGDLTFTDISGTLQAQTAGGDIEAKGLYGSSDIHSAGGDVRITHSTGRLSLTTSGGEIFLKGIEKESRAKTAGGDIKATDITGQLSLETMGGDISLNTVQARINASTKGGDVTANNIEAPLHVNTMGGDLLFQQIRSSVSARTMGGDIELELTPQDPSRDHELDLQTTGGSIEVTLPADLPASIEAEIRIEPGADLFKRYDIYSDFPLTKSQPEGRGERYLKSSGDINGGGDPVRLKANGGDIYIRKAETR